MAQAMIRGFLSTGVIEPANVTASDSEEEMLKYVKELGVNTTQDNKELVFKSRLIVLAVKPNIICPVLQEVSEKVTKDKIIVSIAAGIPTASIEQELPAGSRVVRVMPNTPALVLAAASVVAPGQCADPDDVEIVVELLSCIGICEVGTESILDAVTGVSGSGPAYAFTAIEALSDGGVKMGLPRDLATKLAAQTLLGAAKMVLENNQHPSVLKDQVCSPGGTTIAAVHKLEQAGFRAALMDAVEAATLKARELGSSD